MGRVADRSSCAKIRKDLLVVQKNSEEEGDNTARTAQLLWEFAAEREGKGGRRGAALKLHSAIKELQDAGRLNHC